MPCDIMYIYKKHKIFTKILKMKKGNLKDGKIKFGADKKRPAGK